MCGAQLSSRTLMHYAPGPQSATETLLVVIDLLLCLVHYFFAGLTVQVQVYPFWVNSPHYYRCVMAFPGTGIFFFYDR